MSQLPELTTPQIAPHTALQSAKGESEPTHQGQVPSQGDDVPTAGENNAYGTVSDPLFLPASPIWTPEIDRKVALSIEWIVGDMRGGLIKGLPLIGKSHFLLYARKVIPFMLGGGVCVHLWSFLGYACGGKEDVLRSLLLQSGCRAVGARSPAILLARLVDHLAGAAQAINASRVLLLVDELQELPIEMYPLLMSITSALQTEGLLPCCISMAQTEIQGRIDELHDQAKLQLIGRFFSQVETYQALSLDDTVETIKNLDASQGLTAKWFPELHANGWNLEKLGSPLRESVDLLRAERGLAQQCLLPFSHLRPAIKYMLRTLMQAEDGSKGLTTEQVCDCLVRTGYPAVMHHYIAQGD
jgi:hypothetical protein